MSFHKGLKAIQPVLKTEPDKQEQSLINQKLAFKLFIKVSILLAKKIVFSKFES
jgi:hypothetical protein